MTAGFELIGKTDLRFTDTLYKVRSGIYQRLFIKRTGLYLCDGALPASLSRLFCVLVAPGCFPLQARTLQTAVLPVGFFSKENFFHL